MMTNDPLKAARQYYKISEEAKRFVLRCKKCRVAYELAKRDDGNIAVGNTLALLNHAYSHFPHEDDEDDCE